MPQPPRLVFGRNVSRLRNERGLTQEELAEMAEIDRRYVQRIEAGTANPGIDIIVRVKNALAVNWEKLLDATGKAGR